MQSVQAFITNNDISPRNKLRLLILYALRYQKTQANNIASLITLALQNGVRPEEARVNTLVLLTLLGLISTRFKLVYAILNIAGADHRQDDLYSTESLLALGRSALKGLKVNRMPWFSYTYLTSSCIGSGKCVYATHTTLI